MKSKNVFMYGMIVLISLLGLIWIWESRRSRTVLPKQPTEPLTADQLSNSMKELAGKFTQLKNELGDLIRKAGSEELEFACYEYIKQNPEDMVRCLSKAIGSESLDMNIFNGVNMKDSVSNIYDKDRTLYDALGKCGILKFMGKVVAVSAWYSNTKDLSRDSFVKFTDCTKAVDWANFETWQHIDLPSGSVVSCI